MHQLLAAKRLSAGLVSLIWKAKVSNQIFLKMSCLAYYMVCRDMKKVSHHFFRPVLSKLCVVIFFETNIACHAWFSSLFAKINSIEILELENRNKIIRFQLCCIHIQVNLCISTSLTKIQICIKECEWVLSRMAGYSSLMGIGI